MKAQKMSTKLVNAYENTYGKGINPEAVEELLDVLKEAVKDLKYLIPEEGRGAAFERAEIAIKKAEL